MQDSFFKLTSKYKPIVCALENYNLNSKEKFEPGPGSNPGPGSDVSLEFKFKILSLDPKLLQIINSGMVII